MKTYMLCNAHLDPIWLWQWESGFGEALSTFRQASKFIDEYPDFVFNHNEALLYQWIEEHDPALFERIKRQVKEGRWKIIGGWFLQPDVNLPTGEDIVRQALKGRIYFYDKFGSVPVTAVNFDSFGHAQGLVQVLRQCGYRYYLNIRPGSWEYDFPDENFVWRGYDGSEVIAHRSDKGYNSVFGKVGEELPEWREKYTKDSPGLYCWGVGNHGGGPSRIDLEAIKAMKESGADIEHSTPDEYFKTVDKTKLHVLARGLNPVSEGCYTSVNPIKNLHRKLENDLITAETMASHAALAGLSVYETQKIDEAWKDLMFAEFHDSLPGSCIKKAADDIVRQLQHGLEITNKLKAKYFIALTAGQEKLTDGDTVPVMVYNPHPFAVKQAVDVEFLLPRQLWHEKFSVPVAYRNGKRLPSQCLKESGNFTMDWCKRIVFEAELPAMSMSRFDLKFDVLDKRPEPDLCAENGKITVVTARGSVTVNTATGTVDSYKIDGEEYLKAGAFRPDVYADSFNSWDGKGTFDPEHTEGCFLPMTSAEATRFAGIKGGDVLPVRVVEEGEVETVIEADLRYHLSQMVIRYVINKLTGILDVEVKVFFAENEKRLKLHVPTAVNGGKWIGQTMFGREELRQGKGDTVSQYWQTLVSGEKAVTIINDGVYASFRKDDSLEVTLLRTAGYGASKFIHGEPFHEPMYQQRMDMGEHNYRFRLLPTIQEADREAAVFNRLPYSLAYCPSGEGEKPEPLVQSSNPSIAMSCFKKSERDDDAYILRLFDSEGNGGNTVVKLPLLELEKEIAFRSFEIKTFRITSSGMEETDMLEGAVPIET